MATIYKIHPAIGIARVGNSPDEFFIGPERIGERPNPTGGFKDALCRVKRQAARFRIFAHHDDDTVEEITHADAEIEWTVHLVNKKAANPERNNTETDIEMTIDPGTQTLNGPNQIQEFDTGQIHFSGVPPETVYLGEIRSDIDNHLIVLGGRGLARSPEDTDIGSFWGNSDWYDDVSDGPVTVKIKIRATNEEPVVSPAWAIVAPPKFAPHIDNVITLYDRIYQTMADATPALLATPTTTTYTKDIFPILQRARDSKWVIWVGGGHGESNPDRWVDPVMDDAHRNAIFNRLTVPDSGMDDMPELLAAELTPIQYAHMQRWNDNNAVNFTNDWIDIPLAQVDITPDGLDRAALENCVGAAFFPGIEAGGRTDADRPITDESNYIEAFRLNHAVVGPGDISYTMALPWHADFYACADNWWPVPRPNTVLREGVSETWYANFGSNYEDMVLKWHKSGFVVQQGNQHVEVDRCDSASITLLTPYLNFLNIPQGTMSMVREQPLAITFEVISPDTDVTLEYASGGAPSHPQLTAINHSVTVEATTTNQVVTARLWIVFRTDAVGEIPLQTVTVREVGGTKQWTITIDGNTIARKTAATALVLDRSGSMSADRGDGESKHTSMQQAANIFIDLMLEGDGVGLIRYNHNAQALQQILQLGDGGLADVIRNNTKDLVNGNSLDPEGATSIGDGIFEASNILNSTAISYDQKVLVVLTDGKENSSRFISDVAVQINEQTFAIGFGTPQNTSAAALQTISGNNGGYLLVTGAIGQDNRFQLQKYFLQILAGISNAEVVLDPDGELIPGQVQRISFQLTEADNGVDVILLTPYTKIVDFRLQTPTGLIIEPWRAMAEAGMNYVSSDGVSYYRLVLPAQLVDGRFSQSGTWHALLKIGRQHIKATSESEDGVDRSILLRRSLQKTMTIRNQLELEGIKFDNFSNDDIKRKSLPYSLIVHSYSSISLGAGINQTSFEPGAKFKLHASLTEFGIPMKKAGSIWADVTQPDGTVSTVTLKKQDMMDHFTATFNTTVAGVYHFRIRANGYSRSGMPLSREYALTAAVWHGGDRDADNTSGGSGRSCNHHRHCNKCFSWLYHWLHYFCIRKYKDNF